jgi:hypothetical protein
MVALLIEDVTLVKTDTISIQVRFKGGATTSFSIPIPLNAWQGRKTPDHIVSLINRLLDQNTERQVAKILNDQGCITGAGAPFNIASVCWICTARGLKSHKQRLQARGLQTRLEMAKRFGVSTSTISAWYREGIVVAEKCNDKGEKLYFPNQQSPQKSTKMDVMDASKN